MDSLWKILKVKTEKERVKQQNKKIILALEFRWTVMWQHCWGTEKSNPTGGKSWRDGAWGVWVKRKHCIKCSGERSAARCPDVRNREAAWATGSVGCFSSPWEWRKEKVSAASKLYPPHPCMLCLKIVVSHCRQHDRLGQQKRGEAKFPKPSGSRAPSSFWQWVTKWLKPILEHWVTCLSLRQELEGDSIRERRKRVFETRKS